MSRRPGWHWIDPAVRYARAWQALAPGGHLATWSAGHVFPVGGDPFFLDIQDVYDEIGEGMPPGTAWPRPGELPDDTADIEASGCFEVIAVRQYDWERDYGAEEYIALLRTFSGHLVMAEWQRERLYGEIRRRLGLRPGRSVRRGWGAVLQVAQRLDNPGRKQYLTCANLPVIGCACGVKPVTFGRVLGGDFAASRAS